MSSKKMSPHNSKMQQSPLEISDVELLLWRSLSRKFSPSWISNDLWTAYQALPTVNVVAGPSLLILCNFVDLCSIFHVYQWHYSPPHFTMNFQQAIAPLRLAGILSALFLFSGLCHSCQSSLLCSRNIPV